MKTDLILHTEAYVRKLMDGNPSNALIAHDFRHVDRVRNWALFIAGQEGYDNLEIIEITALLHDIGLTETATNERKNHGPIGANLSAEFLHRYPNLDKENVELICDAIRFHSRSPAIVNEHFAALKDKGGLLKILRDADNLDAFGAVGLLRAFMSHYHLPEYTPGNIVGDGRGISMKAFEKQSGTSQDKGLAPVNTVIDQVIQQIGYYRYLHTGSARQIAGPLVAYMKNFILQLEKEVMHQ